ncbi:MAG: hypothetical protein K2Q10_11395, partial [Rhodospirillales bacterium]|nr:hypothetical protein [Rhodospirillales bacterium]
WSGSSKGGARAGRQAELRDAARDGDFTLRVHEEMLDGPARHIATCVNGMLTETNHVLSEVAQLLRALADGDLNHRLDVVGGGIFADMRRAASDMSARLSDVVRNIRSAVGEVRNASQEGAHESEVLAHRAKEQAAGLESTTSAIEGIAQVVQQTADNAATAVELATIACKTASTGSALTGDMILAMDRIHSKSRDISKIVGLIDEIAFQTNLLALNAAVEAARVGEAGKGFAVVAQEVRSLAERSAEAAKSIRVLVSQAGDEVANGTEVVSKVADGLHQLGGAMENARSAAGEISLAVREQASGIEEIRGALVSLDKITQGNLSMAANQANRAGDLVKRAGAMAEAVEFLQLS